MEREHRILIVDDDEFALQSMARILKNERDQIVTVASGSEAIERLKQAPFDLILTDLKMPDVDGLEVLRQAREIAPQAVVLILTAYAALESGIAALREGAYDYLVKPCSDDELTLKIERGLERVRLREERQQAKEALRESEETYRLLTEHMTDVIWTMDMDLRFTYVSPAVTELLGYSVEDAMAQALEEVLTPASFEVAREALANALTAVEPEDRFEFELRRKDGSTIWAEVNAALLRDLDGRPVGILGIARDINERKEAEAALRRAYDELEMRVQERTVELAKVNDALRTEIIERRRAEEALQESHRQLASRERLTTHILDSIPSSLVAMDRALRIVSANRNFLEKTRREEQTTLGRKIEEVFPQVLLQYTRLGQKVQEVFRAGESIEGGKLSYRAPGLPTRIYYYRLIPLKLAMSHALSGAEGGVEGTGETVENVLLLMDDVTEREKLAEEVRLAERHLASVVECANDVVISMDPLGQILTWNQAAEKISGLRADHVQGKGLVSLCAAEGQPAMKEILQRLVRGENVQNTEVNLLTASGRDVPIAWGCSSMRDDAGKVAGIVAVGRDLTERRRLEEQLIQSAKMASLGVMAGGIAHELRNPLGIISAGAQLLLEHPDDAQLRTECTQKIYAATQRASLIIENLLKFARPTGERMRETDINGVLEETIALMAHQMALQKVSLKKTLQPDLPRVYGNPDLLQQVFINLILNAHNAMTQGGTLTVATCATEVGQTAPPDAARWVEARFTDTGRGIPPEILPKIFDPFFTTMPVGKGVGLGLSISYSILQQHQGTIEVGSKVGKGTTFTVRLPGGK